MHCRSAGTMREPCDHRSGRHGLLLVARSRSLLRRSGVLSRTKLSNVDRIGGDFRFDRSASRNVANAPHRPPQPNPSQTRSLDTRPRASKQQSHGAEDLCRSGRHQASCRRLGFAAAKCLQSSGPGARSGTVRASRVGARRCMGILGPPAFPVERTGHRCSHRRRRFRLLGFRERSSFLRCDGDRGGCRRHYCS
jgi:hypothetical protein